MPPPAPFPLVPLPASGGACPRDGTPLDLAALHFAGARFLMEGRCATCGHDYLQDLPSGHALVYPTTLDLTTGEAHGQWFETELREAHAAPDVETVELEVRRRRQTRRPVLLNALDPTYGHALLKLLNAQRMQRERDVVVLAPAALEALVPASAAETWLLHGPLGRLRGWLARLDTRVREELARFQACDLAPAVPHPHPSTFDLEHFTGPLRRERVGEPSVVLCLRADRLWGRNPRDQRRRFGAVAAALRTQFPQAGLAAVGVVEPGLVPDGALDLTSAAPDGERERRWLAVLAGADLALGVHGSNMLLPSGLARATIELLPQDRFGNVVQASLVTDPDPLASLFRHRTLYGADDLRDVEPERVAQIAASALAGGAHFRARQLGPMAGQDDISPRPSEPQFGSSPSSRWQPVR